MCLLRPVCHSSWDTTECFACSLLDVLTEYVDINEYLPMSRAAKKIPYETTLLVRDCCLCLHVQRAARALARRFDEALRPLGLTNGQFSLMTSLNRPKPPAIGAVAALLAMDRTTLTAALKPLERRALVQVTADPADRRSRLMTLTPEGRSLLVSAVPVWERTHLEVEGLIPDGDPNGLRNNLRALS
jgi:DNA-binding MarR family transcriptional regulator